jgi:hypothetical protein
MCSGGRVLLVCQDDAMQRTVTQFHLHDIAGQQAADLAYWLAQPVRRVCSVRALKPDAAQ